MERLIFHIDVNSAFLSWESARRVSQGIPEKMWPLPVRNLLFLGKASEQKLLNQGIRTIGDLARHIAMGTDDYMETHFGSYDCEIHSFDDMEEFNMAYSSILKDNDNILIKASHAMKFADIVELLSKDN